MIMTKKAKYLLCIIVAFLCMITAIIIDPAKMYLTFMGWIAGILVSLAVKYK